MTLPLSQPDSREPAPAAELTRDEKLTVLAVYVNKAAATFRAALDTAQAKATEQGISAEELDRPCYELSKKTEA